MTRARRLAVPAGLLELIGALEAIEGLRQRRRGSTRSLVNSDTDLDPGSVRLLALTWWPAGIAALVAAGLVPGFDTSERRRAACVTAGLAVTGTGIALRQWSIRTLGEYFVGHVEVQPDQKVVSAGPYRWLRHPSYAGMWLEIIGVGLSTGNAAGAAICATVPLAGIIRRVTGEERELAARLTGYREYARGRARLVPFVW